MLVVVDTNILVSAFWSRTSELANIVALLQNGVLTACYDQRILTEYREVLARPKFGFNDREITYFLSQIENDGLSVVPAKHTVTERGARGAER